MNHTEHLPAEAPPGDLAPIPGPASDIARILTLAVETKVPVETIERLVALQERMLDRSAAAEFNAALAAFQHECPSIPKTSIAKIATKSGGDYGYRYAELDQIAKVTRPLLQKHGLAYSWDMEMQDAKVVCTCTLRHVAGHSQSAKFVAPTDAAASMSGPQKHAAALTYARRQSLIQVLGLTTTDPDTDAGAPKKITDEQVMALNDLIQDSGTDLKQFLGYMAVEAVADINAADFKKAEQALQAKLRAKGKKP